VSTNYTLFYLYAKWFMNLIHIMCYLIIGCLRNLILSICEMIYESDSHNALFNNRLFAQSPDDTSMCRPLSNDLCQLQWITSTGAELFLNELGPKICQTTDGKRGSRDVKYLHWHRFLFVYECHLNLQKIRKVNEYLLLFEISICIFPCVFAVHRFYQSAIN
jgi:hypothetical protein